VSQPDRAPSEEELTALLRAVGQGQASLAAAVLPAVYDELRRLAHARMAKLPPRQTLQATELVHEVWLRLSAGAPDFASRVEFFRAAARAMRNILVDRARFKSRLKRDASRKQAMDTDLPEIEPAVPLTDVLAIHEALERLEQSHERPARVVELRFFTGLSMPEVAEILDVSLATAERDWRFARAWLQDDMGAGEA
jgi:RNA polymerase sigma factor (TIGR02999 family)